ncbi:hypothetical protein A5886_001397 [Enterococcus sp. 8G7_MSG3316]|uniref:DAGKc domain-containing protein n=1 Tax=Candidatus Enterococcus testudinis TaxID=1834191 RepID=A0A242A5Z8_9ENTE|nr:diacylglycerol kinase family protein [Enterococcus sp. 8G7_MSG3316]OTN76320.1 hypothetical protein A5886_001397 [Enterococcus sp. 8G7_MSG3316]
MNSIVLYNDTAGKSEAKESAEQFQAYVKEQQPEANVVLQPSNPDTDPEEVRQTAKDHDVDTVVIIGGDGTIHDGIQTFKDQLQDLKIGIIPGGTVNNFAKMLGIPVKPEEAFETILNGTDRGIDYGMVNDQVMISTMTIGLLADTAAATSQEEKQQYGPLAFMKRFFYLLFKKKQYKLEMVSDQRKWQGKAQLVTIIMSNSAGGFTNFDESARPDDGEFHVILLPKLNILAFIVFLPRIIRGRISKVPSVEYFTASEISIRAKEKKVQTRTDGDPTDDLPVDMKVIKHGLTMRVPADKIESK